MKHKDLKIDFRYLSGNIACLSVDSISGESVHNDINNEEAIIIFNSLVGEKENCQTVKTLLQENQELKSQLENKYSKIGTFTNEVLYEENTKLINQQKEFISYLENEMKSWTEAINEEHDYELVQEFALKCNIYEEILSKFKEIMGVSNEK